MYVSPKVTIPDTDYLNYSSNLILRKILWRRHVASGVAISIGKIPVAKCSAVNLLTHGAQIKRVLKNRYLYKPGSILTKLTFRPLVLGQGYPILWYCFLA